MATWFPVVQLIMAILMPIVLGCISWLALSAIEGKTSGAVLTNRVTNLENRDAELFTSLQAIKVSVTENAMDGKRIEEKIEAVGKVILERMEGLAYRLKLVEKS